MELCFYMGLLQFALGLSRTKGESHKDSYSTKPRENPEIVNKILVKNKNLKATYLH